jgi:colanic acid/amylovoran biosynthesis glycosyltransferase
MHLNENPSSPGNDGLWSTQMPYARTQSSGPKESEHNYAPKLAVLLSKHPCNTNFLAAGEIQSLRKLGHDISLSALDSPLKDCVDFSPEIRAETEATFYLRGRSRLREIASHGRALANPLSYLRLLYCAIRLDGWLGLIRNKHVTDVLLLEHWLLLNAIKHMHAHFGTEAARVAVLMKHFRGVTLSLTLGNTDELHHAGKINLVQNVEAADFIICSGVGARTALMRLTPHHQWHKFEICTPGVDVLRFQPRPSRLKPEVFTILCVGQLEPLNGQRIVLETCRLLRQSGRNVRLVLVGIGSDENELKKLAEADIGSSVIFTGALHQERICDWYNRADVFVSCSLSDGIPLPVMEAMASGLPCISARTTTMLDLMREGSEGLLVEPDSAHELAGAIMRLMDDDSLAKRLSGHGRARILQKYSLTRTAERFGSLFQSRLTSKSMHRKRHISAS